jgi:hypothetical protein
MCASVTHTGVTAVGRNASDGGVENDRRKWRSANKSARSVRRSDAVPPHACRISHASDSCTSLTWIASHSAMGRRLHLCYFAKHFCISHRSTFGDPTAMFQNVHRRSSSSFRKLSSQLQGIYSMPPFVGSHSAEVLHVTSAQSTCETFMILISYSSCPSRKAL